MADLSLAQRKIIGLKPGDFALQAGRSFSKSRFGWDTGKAQWLTHPDTPASAYPQIGTPSSVHARMFAVKAEPEEQDSGLVLISAQYQGVMNFTGTGAVLKERFKAGCGVSIFTLPARSGDTAIRVVAKVPKPRITREYLTTAAPSNAGVGGTASAAFFPDIPSFSISFVADPDEPATHNYLVGWILVSRDWETIGNVSYVSETYAYDFNIAV